MGLFISHCLNCKGHIHWFLQTPKKYICKKCGEPVSEDEIEKTLYMEEKDLEKLRRIKFRGKRIDDLLEE